MIKTIKKVLCIFLALTLVCALCGCETWDNFRKAFIDPADPAKTIKIGILEPLTGRTSYDAEDEILGMELAYETLNQIGEYKIELIYEDNRSNTTVCADAAQRLIDQGCAIILGSVSDTLSLAASDTIKAGKIPAIAATCTVPVLTKSNEYYFRVSCINSFDASAAADYVYDVLESDRVAILLPKDSDYAQEKADLFKSEFETLSKQTEFEYTKETVDPETKKVTKETVKYSIVNLTYITGEETDEELELLYSILEDLGYYSIYCLCDTETSLDLIYQSRQHKFRQYTEEELDALKPKTPDLTTHAYWNDKAEWVEEIGYWDSYGNWVKWVEPDEPEQLPDHFTWVGSSDWTGLAELAKERYGNEELGTDEDDEKTKENPLDFLLNVSYTLDYDSDTTQTDTSLHFLDAFHTKYGEDKTPTDNMALGYDAYLLAYNAIQETITYIGNYGATSDLFDENGVFNRELLQKQLLKTYKLPGVTGSITINSYGDPTKDVLIEAWNGDEFKTIYTVVPNYDKED